MSDTLVTGMGGAGSISQGPGAGSLKLMETCKLSNGDPHFNEMGTKKRLSATKIGLGCVGVDCGSVMHSTY